MVHTRQLLSAVGNCFIQSVELRAVNVNSESDTVTVTDAAGKQLPVVIHDLSSTHNHSNKLPVDFKLLGD